MSAANNARIVISWSAKAQAYVARDPARRGVLARGATLAEAARKLAVAVEPPKQNRLLDAMDAIQREVVRGGGPCVQQGNCGGGPCFPRRASSPRVRLVFDTNVLVSALLTPGGTCDRAVRTAISTNATLLYDVRMLAEYRSVLSRAKFRTAITPGARDRLLSALAASAERIQAAGADEVDLPDPADVPFLQVALAGAAVTSR